MNCLAMNVLKIHITVLLNIDHNNYTINIVSTQFLQCSCKFRKENHSFIIEMNMIKIIYDIQHLFQLITKSRFTFITLIFK